MERLTAIALFFTLTLLICSASVSAGRLMKYDRTTGQTTVLATNVTNAATAINSSKCAYWDSSGVHLVNLSDGSSSLLSSDAYVSGANFDMSENYITWNGKVKNLSTGEQQTCATTAKLYGDYMAYGSGTSYTVKNLVTSATTNISVPNGVRLDDINSTSIVVKNKEQYHVDQWGFYWYWECRWVAYNFSTGAATGWSTSLDSQSTPTGMVSDSWFALTYEDNENVRVGKCPMNSQANNVSTVSDGVAEDVCGTYAVGRDIESQTIVLWNLQNSTSQCIFDVPFHLRYTYMVSGARVSQNYVTWTDTYVPEPTTLSMVGLLLGGVLLRRRRR